MKNFWPSCGFDRLQRNAGGWLVPSDGWWRLALQLPQLQLVEESCANERALHEALLESPLRPVPAQTLAALADADAAGNYRLLLRFRDAVQAAGTLEAWYLALMRSGQVDIPPMFIDWVVQAIVRNLLDDCSDAFEARAAEMLFRPQRISRHDAALLAGDAPVLDLLNTDGGLGEIGRLLSEFGAPLRSVQLRVLSTDNSADYWASDTRHDFLLDLSLESRRDLGHGIEFKLGRARSGLKALARVLEKWVGHLLGVAVRIEPVARIDDAAWRWHVGLDAQASALLDDLYQEREVEAQRLARLLGLFRLDFADPAEMRADVTGKPVYLGLAMNEDQLLRLKPQNLLLNLPLAASS
ncbi:MAG: DUF6352 family protein [Rubrivivax sp.]